MSPSPHVPHYVELLVPNAETEQEFLLLAVQAAVMKYRKPHSSSINPPEPTCDEACSLQEHRC